jgi:2-polyprenyl-3-methyl-5-hydroxy-6-metoxy-1,4-benzoquinol methylase
VQRYFRALYRRTVRESYGMAHREAIAALQGGGDLLDCGAGSGHLYGEVLRPAGVDADRYRGIEWHADTVAQAGGLDVRHGDLNQPLPFAADSFRCVIGLSVLEHLLKPCAFLRQCHRVLAPGGTLVILTPNISTYFTAALILAGRMPSSGPTPDSAALVKSEELFEVSRLEFPQEDDTDTPQHRHLVIFSFLVLRRYLRMLGFRSVRGHGFGLYPFPNVMQPMLEKLDPYHCHQMVFVAVK